jgi:hypothetical protein
MTPDPVAVILSAPRFRIISALVRAPDGVADVDALVHALDLENPAPLSWHRRRLAHAGLVRLEGDATVLTSAGRAAMAQLGAAITDALKVGDRAA